jgi:hypothetical protein
MSSKFIKGSRPKQQYLSVPNSMIRDAELSPDAFRLICWINSHADNFEISLNCIQKAFGYGRDKIQGILKNAIECGYLIRQRINDAATGTFQWLYAVFMDKADAVGFTFETPKAEAERVLPVPDKPVMETADMATYIDKENKKEENNKRENALSTFDFFEVETTSDLVEPKDQEPEDFSIQESLIDISQQQPVSSLVPVSSASFDNPEQVKIEKFRELDAEGIKLKQPELREWAKLEIGEYVKTYRRSGFILTGGNDVSNEFAVYVAKQNCRKGQEPTIALGFNVINKCEQDPRSWQKLVIWVQEWQQSRASGEKVNVAASVSYQQSLERIRRAASTKFDL